MTNFSSIRHKVEDDISELLLYQFLKLISFLIGHEMRNFFDSAIKLLPQISILLLLSVTDI